MKRCWLCYILVWFVLVVVTGANYNRLQKGQIRTPLSSTLKSTRKRNAAFSYRSQNDSSSWRLDGKVTKTSTDDTALHTGLTRGYKGAHKETGHRKNQRQKVSHNSAQLPKPAKPLRVVATSAAIKNRLKKPGNQLKAIHIWGPTPFGTVLENLRKLNDNIRREQGAVKRLILPYQLPEVNLMNSFVRPPPPQPPPQPPPPPPPPPPLLPRPIASLSHTLSRAPLKLHPPLPVPPDAIHLHEGPPLRLLSRPVSLTTAPVGPSSIPDRVKFISRPIQISPEPAPHGPVPHGLVLPGRVALDPFPPDTIPPVLIPAEQLTREPPPRGPISPGPLAPAWFRGFRGGNQVPAMGTENEMGPIRVVAPVREMLPAPSVGPVEAMDPKPELFAKNFDIPDLPPRLMLGIPPNFGPPYRMLEPPFPWLAGEIHEEVNRHVHKGKTRARCSPNPCKNDGTCTAFEKHYECTCPIGFMGKNCEVVNHCLPNPCKNEGNCYAIINGYTCTCIKGFKGPNCDVTNKCIPNPCKNGGTCEETGATFKCNCLVGYKGSNCEAADHCGVTNPCKNGGTCVNGQMTFECHCLPGFSGTDCGDLDVCYSNPCQNSGTCRNLGAGQFMCQCTHQFRGITCDERISRCESQPCQNGGTCVEDDEGGFHCICSAKYQGEHCQELRSACNKHPCLNGGKCVDHDDTFRCICVDGFDGTTCEVKLTTTPPVCSDCHEHSKCVDGKCTCDEGYFGNGNVCEVVKGLETNSVTATPEVTSLVDTGGLLSSVCHPNPCFNDGVCHETLTGFSCACPLNYIGPVCKGIPETSVCHPNPCYNGGTCHETVTGFACSCPVNYIGPVCKDVSPCLANPCQHGGTCIEGGIPGVYSCRCTEGYSGKNCEESENTICEPNPCQNGGTCLVEHQSFVCKCSTRFEGLKCEEDKCAKCDVHAHCEEGECVCDGGYYGEGTKGECFRTGASNPRFCSPNPCQHGGSCFEEPNGYHCACTTDFEGENCELTIGAAPPSKVPDPCAGKPCQNGGTCIPRGNKFHCSCFQGFQGPTCGEKAKSYCHPSPCLHGGTCLEDKDGYICRCIGSYRGVSCEVDDCDQCDIHALCVKGACRCRVGYKGDGFECEKIKRCHHCSPNATCINSECVCKPGFIGSGKHCHKDDCKGCPPHSHCLQGICICIPGFYFDGHHCIAATPATSLPHCPGECTKGSDCPSTCPHHCCRITVHPVVETCPRQCKISCEPTCPDRCCTKVRLPDSVVANACPSECHETCHQSCSRQCCQVIQQPLGACPGECSVSCAPSCPSHCCVPQYLPTVAPTQQTCSSVCSTNCLPSCPSHCCKTAISNLTPCPSECKQICSPSCPIHCCIPVPFHPQPTLIPQMCPSACLISCLPSCPKFCCQLSVQQANTCPSHCAGNCIPPCPQSCCPVPYLPKPVSTSTVACPPTCATQCLPSCPQECCSSPCPSQCARNCDTSCPPPCCENNSSLPSYLPQKSMMPGLTTGGQSRYPQKLQAPCPTYCRTVCISSCPAICCKREQLQTQSLPALAKVQDINVSPYGRSFPDEASQYKSNMLHRLSQLLSSALTHCQPSCFSRCSENCPRSCCDARKKMVVFRRKKKTQIPRIGHHRNDKGKARKVSLKGTHRQKVESS